MTIPEIKNIIWESAGKDLTRVNRAIAASQPREDTIQWWQRVLLHVQVTPVRAKAKHRESVPDHVLQRYKEAHQEYQAKEYPASTKDFGGLATIIPDTRTANGLTRFCINYLLWQGWNATRISVSGRMIKDKYIPGTTRKGRADIGATIAGRAVQLEIKVGKDKPSEAQLSEQMRERAAGGCYEFIYDGESFFIWYDQFILSLNTTTADSVRS